MICNVTLYKNKTNQAAGLFVPNRAVLVDDQGRNFVYVVNANKAVRKYVKTGKLLSNGVEITEGLNDGEQIVVAGQQKLVDNSSVYCEPINYRNEKLMKKKRTLIETLLCHKQLIIAGTTLLVLFGIVALTQMPRDEFPEFKIRQGLIIEYFRAHHLNK